MSTEALALGLLRLLVVLVHSLVSGPSPCVTFDRPGDWTLPHGQPLTCRCTDGPAARIDLLARKVGEPNFKYLAHGSGAASVVLSNHWKDAPTAEVMCEAAIEDEVKPFISIVVVRMQRPIEVSLAIRPHHVLPAGSTASVSCSVPAAQGLWAVQQTLRFGERNVQTVFLPVSRPGDDNGVLIVVSGPAAFRPRDRPALVHGVSVTAVRTAGGGAEVTMNLTVRAEMDGAEATCVAFSYQKFQRQTTVQKKLTVFRDSIWIDIKAFADGEQLPKYNNISYIPQFAKKMETVCQAASAGRKKLKLQSVNNNLPFHALYQFGDRHFQGPYLTEAGATVNFNVSDTVSWATINTPFKTKMDVDCQVIFPSSDDRYLSEKIILKPNPYFLVEGLFNHTEAAENCSKAKGRLAVIRNEKEMRLANAATKGKQKCNGDFGSCEAHVGLVRKGKEWKWKMLSKQTFSFWRAWSPGQPSGSGNCTRIQFHSFFDTPCSKPLSALCSNRDNAIVT